MDRPSLHTGTSQTQPSKDYGRYVPISALRLIDAAPTTCNVLKDVSERTSKTSQLQVRISRWETRDKQLYYAGNRWGYGHVVSNLLARLNRAKTNVTFLHLGVRRRNDTSRKPRSLFASHFISCTILHQCDSIGLPSQCLPAYALRDSPPFHGLPPANPHAHDRNASHKTRRHRVNSHKHHASRSHYGGGSSMPGSMGQDGA